MFTGSSEIFEEILILIIDLLLSYAILKGFIKQSSYIQNIVTYTYIIKFQTYG